MPSVTRTRTTKETDIRICLTCNGQGQAEIDTGIGFFDHMLTALAVHSGMNLAVQVKGDLEVDCHHTVEDTGILLGQALAQALGDKNGIARYGDACIPMDEALAFCALDLSGRPFAVFDAAFPTPMCGGYDNQMTAEFFRAVAMNAGLTLHLKVMWGANSHHINEALFKAFAHALQKAMAVTGGGVLSSKGCL